MYLATLIHGCFSRFLNCTNGIISCRVSDIKLAQCTFETPLLCVISLSINCFFNQASLNQQIWGVPVTFWVADSLKAIKPYSII